MSTTALAAAPFHPLTVLHRLREYVLLDLAVQPLVIHDEQIRSRTVGLRTNEQIGAPVSLSWRKQKSIATIVVN